MPSRAKKRNFRFEQQIGEVDMGDTPTDLCFQYLNTRREVLAFVHGYDQFPMLHADAVASVELTVRA
jgi:hypothetical protein